ncbi:hypothetical protein T439DRAFT_348213 [Meredithblackwellia eburnea MCA 4105]
MSHLLLLLFFRTSLLFCSCLRNARKSGDLSYSFVSGSFWSRGFESFASFCLFPMLSEQTVSHSIVMRAFLLFPGFAFAQLVVDVLDACENRTHFVMEISREFPYIFTLVPNWFHSASWELACHYPSPKLAFEPFGAHRGRFRNIFPSMRSNLLFPDDLAFAKGDTITIVEELSPDWWKGSLRKTLTLKCFYSISQLTISFADGRIGLFPSNYVEKITTPAPGPIRAVPPIPQQNSGYGTQNQQQYPAPQDSWNGPGGNYGPLQNNYNASYNAPPPNQYGGQQQPYQPYQPYQPQQSQYAPSIAPSSSEKQDPAPVAAPVPPPIPPKKKLPGGALGKMMATSFAGGIGFGTGTALASEAVHAIF